MKNNSITNSNKKVRNQEILAKKLKIFILIFIFSFLCFDSVFAQNTEQTPYQKKELQISVKYLNIFREYNMSLVEEMVYRALPMEQRAKIFGEALFIYTTNHTQEECKKVFTQMKKEIKQSNKLKTAKDFQREKEEKALKEKEENNKNKYNEGNEDNEEQ
jgi:hypothetical protein